MYHNSQKIKRLLSLLVLFAAMAHAAVGQSATGDFKKLAEMFSAAHTSVDVTYELYATHNGNHKIQSLQGKYYIWEKLLAYRISDIEVFNNERFVLSVDHETKNMVLNRSNPSFDKKLQKELMKINVDSLLSRFAEVTLLDNKNDQRTWRISYTKTSSGISSVDITIDLPAYRLNKIVLYYDRTFDDIYSMAPDKVKKTDKPRLELLYSNYTGLDKKDKEQYFYAGRMLTVGKNGTVKLSDSFKKYHLANYYNLK